MTLTNDADKVLVHSSLSVCLFDTINSILTSCDGDANGSAD